MLGKHKTNYFYESFPMLAEYAQHCMNEVLSFMENFDHEKLEEHKIKVHAIEHEADIRKREVMNKLTREFLTPIDREDILQLLRYIDVVTDAVEEIPMKLYIYDYKELPPDSVAFAKEVKECVDSMALCLQHFPEFPVPGKLQPYIDKVIELEEKTDEIFEHDMHELYVNTTDGFVRHRGEALYTMLEGCADMCRETCKFVQTIMYKNL